jgi:hypothetical protein
MHITNRFQEIKRAYGGSVDRMVERLEAQGVRVHRTTLYRWLNAENDSPHRSKAYLVAQILENALCPGELTLRVAEPDTVLALPSTIACKQPPPGRDARQALAVLEGPLLKKFGVTPLHFVKDTGGETLEMLAEGAVDIAIAATTLIREAAGREPECCARLCTLSRAPFVAIAVEGKTGLARVDDLAERVVGYPLKSGVPNLLAELEGTHTITIKHRKAVESHEDAANDLQKGRTDLFIAWDAYIRRVEAHLRACKVRIVRVLERPLGVLSQDIAVNLETANPAAVRAYLACLLEVVSQLRSNEKFRNDMRVRLNIPIDQRTWKETSYQLHNFDLSTLLKLWGKEARNAASSNSRPQPGESRGQRQ